MSLAIAAGLYLLVKTIAIIHSRALTEDYIPAKADVNFEAGKAMPN
jgi:hypothetical protein